MVGLVFLIVCFSVLFTLARGIYLLFQPGNHPGNVANRKYWWKVNHPGAKRTPWDKKPEKSSPPRKSVK